MISTRRLAAGLIAATTAVLATTAVRSLGGGPQTGMGREDTGAGDVWSNRDTPFQLFANRLKLDSKTQLPAAQQIFVDASKEAQPVAQEMLAIRQRLVNAMLGSRAQDVDPARDAYGQAAAKMVGLEVRAFTSVYSTLKPNQQSGGPEAFAIIAGIFQPAGPEARRSGGGGRGRGDARFETRSGAGPSFAQKGGKGGGAQGGAPVFLTRFEILASAFKFDKSQEKPLKAILDAAGKEATPIRDQLTRSRTGISAAVIGGKPQTDVDAAVKGYADQAAAMAVLEMKALAQVLDSLTKEQMANNGGVQTAFYLVRGMFIDKNWDDIPSGRSY